MTKMTYVQAIDSAINGNINEEVLEKLEALKAQLNKRNASDRKPTKAQKENEVLKAQMVEFLADGEGRQCKAVAEHFGISGNKASALLNQLVKSEVLTKYTEKRVTYFKIGEVA